MTNSNTTDSPRRTGTRSKGELVFDVALVLAIGGYLIVAQTYPPIGRQIPTVVGIIALVAAVVQLIGWFVPGMWKFTHGEQRDDSLVRNAPRAATEVTRNRSGGAQPAPETNGRTVDVPIAMAWAAGFLGAILLFGYVVAVPLFFLVYFGIRRSWVLAIASAVVMGLVTSLLFERLLDIPMYGGLLF
jgi:hypothetical protein